MEKAKIYLFDYTIKMPRQNDSWGLCFSETWEAARAYIEEILVCFPKRTKLVGLRCIGEYVGDFCQIEKN